jgi:FRG domain
MNGQWLGTYGGPAEGVVILNVDERESSYQGVAYLLPNDYKTFPASAAYFQTKDKVVSQFQFRTNSIYAVDPISFAQQRWESVKAHYPDNIAFSLYADVVGSVDAKTLTLSWKTDLDATGGCSLPRSRAAEPSELVPLVKDWGTFKEYVDSLKTKRFLFRGQDGPWRLRTSFHRTGRADIGRFLNEDIRVLRNHLSQRTKHFFNLDVPDELGAFFNLVQHHGYPTPLLDWTNSPYVAAFFAFRHVRKGGDHKFPTVRIHVFDQALWKAEQPQVLHLSFPGSNVSVAEFIAIENERMIPQQAVSTLSNVDDIESYIGSKETADKKYVFAIDLPASERDRVVRDLSYMGITAGSLFPGLDGACEELRERNFNG